MKNTRITGKIKSVEPAMTRSQRVRPMKACWNWAKPRATVYLVGSRVRQGLDEVVPAVDEGEYRHRGQGGFGQQYDCQSMPNSLEPLMGALSGSGFLLSE